MQAEDLTFYHGTGRAAARAILNFGSQDSLLEEIGAQALGREIRRALLRHAKLSHDEDSKLHFAFSGAPGREYSSLWVPALRQLDDDAAGSHFDYGHFFATLNIANAYRYAIGNPYRSEFILALAESLKVLRHLGDELPSMVAMRYPEIARVIESPSPAIVLELRGVSEKRLLGAKGGPVIDMMESVSEMQEYPGCNFPLDFRIQHVTPADIVAVA